MRVSWEPSPSIHLVSPAGPERAPNAKINFATDKTDRTIPQRRIDATEMRATGGVATGRVATQNAMVTAVGYS
jgi:hypothetical protein